MLEQERAILCVSNVIRICYLVKKGCYYACRSVCFVRRGDMMNKYILYNIVLLFPFTNV